MACRHLHFVGNVALVVGLLLSAPAAAQSADPHKLLAEAERLAWLRAWGSAEPMYAEAERLFTAAHDQQKALYARVSRIRGELPRRPVPEVSEQLAEYLDDPLVQSDARLRLRCLVVKGETDTDLDPVLAERSWREALTIAERLGEAAWANRARGELGLLAFLEGDVNGAAIQLGQALKVAESNGDAPSVVRWLTLFGDGYVELDRPAEALDMYDRAIKIAATVPELQFPDMTYVGKGDALEKLGRLDEAERVLNDALAVVRKEGSLGYQAELMTRLARLAERRKALDRASELLDTAADLAEKAGGYRLVAEASLERGRLLRLENRPVEAARALDAGVTVARSMQEPILLPRLLSELADLWSSEKRFTEAANLLEEASDLLEGMLTRASSPWVQSRIINGARDVVLARICLEGARGADPARLFGVIEQARGRALSRAVGG